MKAVSLPIGALTLTGTYQKGDEYTPKELEKMTKAVKKTIKEQYVASKYKTTSIRYRGYSS